MVNLPADTSPREYIRIMALAVATGVLGGWLLGAVLNHEIAEVNEARAAHTEVCP
jgi:hypothetical protein